MAGNSVTALSNISNDNMLFIDSENSSIDLSILPDENFQSFINECNELSSDFLYNYDDDSEELYTGINSRYYSVQELNNLKIDHKSDLSVCHTNIASLSKHFDNLHLLLSSLKIKFNVIGITEHKIYKDAIPTTNIDIEGYWPFVYDPTSSSHGGTGFFISESINYKKRDDLKFNSCGDFESTFIEIILPSKKNLIIGCIYRHPSSPISIKDFNSTFIEPLLNKISTEGKLCSLMGDFNIDLLKYDLKNDFNDFFNLLSSHFFTPYILQPTRPISKSLIDNIFFNSIEFSSYSGNLTIQLADHLFQFVLLQGFFKEIVPNQINIFKRNFKNFNENEFQEAMNLINWESILQLEFNNPNLSLQLLHDNIVYLLDEFAPYRRISKKEFKLKAKPWINHEILKNIKLRDKLLLKYHKSNDVTNKIIIYAQYKLKRNSITKLKREAKKRYYKDFFELNKTNISIVWKGIKSIVNIKQQSSRKDITLIDGDGKDITDPYKISNSFNKYFVNIGPDIDKTIPKSKHDYNKYLNEIHCNKTLFLVPTTHNEIFDIIKILDINKSTGPNSIPVFILKIFNCFFSEHLSNIINLSFTTGLFPDLCKIAKVIPIFKGDDESMCENYRPISLLPIFSKIFEKVIYTRMYKFVSDNNLIYSKQFGFRANHSTEHALVSLTEDIKTFLDNGLWVAGIFLDLRKAFDTVNHEILLNKINRYGFRGISNKLLQSFLLNRKQFVSIKGFDSELMEVKCGVPQGSTLGPLLFLLYINDLRFCLQNSNVSHFADDTCITHANNDIKSLEISLNSDIDNVTNWLISNRLSLNVKKTKLILFRSKNKQAANFSIKLTSSNIEPVTHVKYLGFHIDNTLSCDYHIKCLSNKLSRANGIISKLRHFVPIKTLLSVYYAIFHSHVLYGCSVWSMTTITNINIINILQKKCLRIMNFQLFNCHSNSLFKDNKILKLNDIIKFQQLKLAFQFKNNLLPNDLRKLFQYNINIFNTRNMSQGGLKVPKISTVSYGNRSLRYNVPLTWNNFINNVDMDNINNLNQLKNSFKKITLNSYVEG